MKTVQIKCEVCCSLVKKALKEINRQKKLGRTKFYCSLECSGKSQKNILRITTFKKNIIGNKREKDKYSKFRWYIKVSKRRGHEFNIDLEYLKNLWISQKGICPFSGKKLTLRTHNDLNNKSIYTASLDRIDNTKGYVKGNVRFVSLMFNYAKNTFLDTDVIRFCNDVTNNKTHSTIYRIKA